MREVGTQRGKHSKSFSALHICTHTHAPHSEKIKIEKWEEEFPSNYNTSVRKIFSCIEQKNFSAILCSIYHLFYMTETIHKFLFPSFTVIKHSGQMQLGEGRVCLSGLHFQVILCYWRAGTHSGNLEAGTEGEHCLLAHSLTCSQVHA